MDINLKSKEEQIEFISKNEIKYLEGQLSVVNYRVDNIKYIKTPCLEVQLAAVNKNGYSIVFIKNPSYEIQLAAIQNETAIYKKYFELIKKYITYSDLLELIELKILTCNK